MPLPEASRALLLPGPQPPLSHLGVTLLRHVVTSGLRYALHSLGAPIPEGAPMRIVRLRLYLDRAGLERALGDEAAAEALSGALLEPAGSGGLPPSAGATRGALRFHRLRLRLWRRRLPRLKPAPGGDAATLWRHLRATLSRLLPALNDALLGELVAALDRRGARAAGETLPACLGPHAHALRAGRQADLSRLGVLDPLAAAWDAAPDVLEKLGERLGRLPPSAPHPLRGGFREHYRLALHPIRASYLKLAEAASERGLIERPGDAFFLPFDLAEDLTAAEPAAWLRETVASNRREYQALLDAPSPPERLGAGSPPELVDDRADWLLAPVWPLD